MSIRSSMRHKAIWLLAGTATALTIRRVRFRRIAIQGKSMEPLLYDGDHIVVTRKRRLRKNDVVLLTDPRAPERMIVKRISQINNATAWVEGDNPSHSTDSRTFGSIPLSSVRGVLRYRYWPPQRCNWIH